MGILAWIIVGLAAGAIANVVYPGGSKGGWMGAMALGILGAIVGSLLAGLFTGQDLVTGFNVTTLVVAALGALLLLFGYNAVTRPRTA